MQNSSRIHIHSDSCQVSTSGKLKLQPHIAGGKLCRAPKVEVAMELAQLAKSKANCKCCGEWSHKLGLSTRGRMASTGLGCSLTWAKNHYHPSLRWLLTRFGWLRYGEKMHFWMSDPLWIICKPIFSVTKMWNFTTFKNTAPKDFEQVFKRELRLPS